MRTDSDPQAPLAITIGNLTVAFKNHMLIFAEKNNPDRFLETSLDAHGIEKLAGFLQGLPVVVQERRLAFRVPLRRDSGLRMKVTKGSTPIDAVPIDISCTGALLELLDEDRAGLAVDDILDVRISFAGDELSLRGQIKRFWATRCGIHFLDSVHNGEVSPPHDLMNVVMVLQRRWLESMAGRR